MMKDYNDLTPMQKLVSKAQNSYPDDVFIEMVQNLDDEEFWQELVIDELTDSECIDILNRLLSMFRDWNIS